MPDPAPSVRSTRSSRVAPARGSAPAWWPEGEAWPPGAKRPRPLALWLPWLFQIAVLTLGLALLVSTALGFRTIPVVSPAIPVRFTVVVTALLISAFAVWRVGPPLAALVAGAERVAAGDYDVRLPEGRWGPPPLATVTHAFNVMVERLAADASQRRRLLANTGHELRGPLTALRSEVEAMIDGIHPADETHLRSVLEEAEVLSQLIDDLRTLSLAESGALQLHVEPLDLAATATDVAGGLAAVAASRGVTVRVEGDTGRVGVIADPLRIREAIANIVSDALRYAPPGSTVLVSVSVLEARAVVAVEDRGPGIPADLLPDLFQRFSRGDDSTGSGLGLAIARELVELHGGTIAAEALPGGGTRIRFELPVGEE